MNLEEALEILESVKDQVTKKYGGMFDKGLSARGLSKHKKVIASDVAEVISAAKRNLPDDKKNSTYDIDREANKIEAKRNNTKNKIGEYKTDLHTIGMGGKLRSFSELSKNREEDKKNGYKKAIEKSIRRHNKKMNKNEALVIAEEMLQLANSIFEVAPGSVAAEAVPPSENKIKKVKKDKENSEKKREVVSVADELFPYEGNAKQQMNQKILDKINQMIEGTATLEDLLQLVRRGTKKVTPVKESFDRAEAMLEELINEVSKEYRNRKALSVQKSIENERDVVDKLAQMNIPKEVIKNLKTDVVRKEHKLYPRLDKIAQEEIKEIEKKKD